MPAYILPDLPYTYDALAPLISTAQLEVHHTEHHAAYVKQANAVLGRLDGADVEDLPALTRAFAFHLSGHVLHSLFWESLTPDQSAPTGRFATEIERSFGSTAALTTTLGGAVTSLMGSGWAALGWEPRAGRLVVTQLHDHQDNVPGGLLPILVIDGWEHAFYIDHRNDKQGWVDAVGELLDWESAGRRYDAARAGEVSDVRR